MAVTADCNCFKGLHTIIIKCQHLFSWWRFRQFTVVPTSGLVFNRADIICPILEYIRPFGQFGHVVAQSVKKMTVPLLIAWQHVSVY